jgi:hypothetical protein
MFCFFSVRVLAWSKVLGAFLALFIMEGSLDLILNTEEFFDGNAAKTERPRRWFTFLDSHTLSLALRVYCRDYARSFGNLYDSLLHGFIS